MQPLAVGASGPSLARGGAAIVLFAIFAGCAATCPKTGTKTRSAHQDSETLSGAALIERHRTYAFHRGAACQPKLPAHDAEALYAHGARRLEDSRDGEHYLAEPYVEALGALRIAAEAGDLRAQALYGTREFGDRFTNDAPQSSEREPYTLAMNYLIIAARRGDERAKNYFGPAGAALVSDRLPETLEMPLSDVPRAWVDDARKRAEAWLRCAERKPAALLRR